MSDFDLDKYISNTEDFPKKGILFKDISPLLLNHKAMTKVIDIFATNASNMNADLIAGIESRGFLLATILALRYNKGIVMVRKAGKLPGKTAKLSYTIEYGKDTIEIQKDILEKGQRVIICDDLLATGGTAKAAGKLIEKVGGEITGFAFIIELTELNGIKGLSKYNCKSLVKY